MNGSNAYPRLTKSYKGAYPFKLGTTSFIYPDYYVPNVQRLGAFFDEIEILVFESTGMESLFCGAVIDELVRLAMELNLRYNIHLPTDISISDHDSRRQRYAVDTLGRIIERMSLLAPSSYCLHIPYNERNFERPNKKKWCERVRANLERLLSVGIENHKLAIETLDYPIDLLEDVIGDLNLTICLDVGHLIRYGYAVADVYHRYFANISSIHLHGVENDHDHVSLERLAEEHIHPVMRILKRFAGIVSLEVFSYSDLTGSLQFLQRCYKNISPTES